jgi:hypothetical protein
MARLDLVVLGDPRPLPAAARLAALLRAAAAGGLAAGFLPALAMEDTASGPADRAVDLALAETGGRRLGPGETVEADLAIVDDGPAFASMPPCRPGLAVRAVLARWPALPEDTDPAALAAVAATLRLLFAAPVRFAAADDLAAAAFAADPAHARLFRAEALPDAVDPDVWRRPIEPPGPAERLRVGLLLAPEDDGLAVLRALSGRPGLDLALAGRALAGPSVEGGRLALRRLADVQRFLARRHVVVTSRAAGFAAEAMASGAVVVLPAAEADRMPGAVAWRGGDLGSLLSDLAEDPQTLVRRVAQGRDRVRRSAAAEALAPLLRRWAGEARPLPAPLPVPVRRPPGPVPVLMVTSNGEGLGHLVRLLAVAERLPAGTAARFLTLSTGASLVRERGHPVDVVASHRRYGLDNTGFNAWLEEELALAIRAFEPGAVVFDGSVPYDGLLRVAEARRDLAWIWIRRALWQGDKRFVARRATAFDRVIEPAEAAAAEDRSEAALERDRVVPVDPILMVAPADYLPRAAARAALGLPAEGLAVVLQAGADGSPALERIRDLLAARPDVAVVDVGSPLASAPGRAAVFPLARLLRAFDLAVTRAGYNSFHECLLAGIPAIYVPKTGPDMDDQPLRAAFAETAGLGLALADRDVFSAGRVLEIGLSEAFRSAVAARAEAVRAASPAVGDGAAAAARIVADLATGWRIGRPLAETTPRR